VYYPPTGNNPGVIGMRRSREPGFESVFRQFALNCLQTRRCPQQQATVGKANPMAIKGDQRRLGATDSGPRPGGFPIGSAQSRAAARAMLMARDANKEEFSVQSYSVVDGKPVNFDGLAETIRAARMRIDVGGEQAALPANEAGQDFDRGRQADCLRERMRRAEDRLARAQGRGTIR
jgi:hypothetical protein